MARKKEPVLKQQTAVYYTENEIKQINKKARLKGMRFSQFVRVTSLESLGIKFVEDDT